MSSNLINYMPTLAVRPSELQGLELLPKVTKDRMTPCFLLAPWMNSKKLDGSIQRINRAFANRYFFLDIDHNYYNASGSKSESQLHFSQIRQSSDAYSAWRYFIKSYNNVWPCLQVHDLSQEQIRSQIDEFRDLGRRYCLRIDRLRIPKNLSLAIKEITRTGAADYIVVLEGGWSRDALTLEAWFTRIISRYLQYIDAQIPIVVSCTTMPINFTEMMGITPVYFENRRLAENISRRYNHLHFVFGDWGSTRPRSSVDFASRPLPRIDYPTRDSWYIARNKENSWRYSDAAKNIVSNEGIWDGGLNVWGEEMIRLTAEGDSNGIASPQKNVASRVNIHLHLQAFYNESNLQHVSMEEDWED